MNSFKKLDKTTEQAVMSAIEKIIDNSRHDKDADLNKVAADVFKATDGMTPELIKRACEAYNKSKSVHTLQKRAADNRAEDFALIDSDLVINNVYGYHKKAAGAFTLNPPALQENMLVELHEGLKKVASDDDEKGFDIDGRAIERQIYRVGKDIEKKLERFHTKIAGHREASEDAMRRVCQIVRRLPSKQIQKVARLTVNRYGDDGVRFMKVVGALTENDFKLQKTAAAAIFPLEEPYTSVSIAIDEAKAHNHFGNMLAKAAGAAWDANKLAAKNAWVDALNATDTASGFLRGAGKVGQAATRKLLDPIAEAVKVPLRGALTMEKSFDDGTKVFSPELVNNLKSLQAKEMFFDVASDDFTKDYPIEDTIQAYNNVVGTMPDLVNERYTPWVKALVREQLVQGNVYDSAAIKQMQDIGKEVAKGRITDVDEAVRTLEQTKGSTAPGMTEAQVSALLGEGGDSGVQRSGGSDKGSIGLKEVEERRSRQSDARLKEEDRAEKARVAAAKEEQAKRKTQAEKDRDEANRKLKKRQATIASLMAQLAEARKGRGRA